MGKKIVDFKLSNPLNFLGERDANLRFLSEVLDGVEIVVRGNKVFLSGDFPALERAHSLVQTLVGISSRRELTRVDIEKVIGGAQVLDTGEIFVRVPKGVIRARTQEQARYLKAIGENPIVFAIGPAGTGKTFLAVAKAVGYLVDKEYERLVLVRPAVEAGERLGYLPGDLKEKVDPYLRPLYDALYEMIPAEKMRQLLEAGIIEILPLAYMRGRTLSNAVVILDEAQNTTHTQMKMFLTRMGRHCKVIITGDITQIDLPSSVSSGLVEIRSILRNVKGVAFIYFSRKDVVRHKLVEEIIAAYERYEAEEDEEDEEDGTPLGE